MVARFATAFVFQYDVLYGVYAQTQSLLTIVLKEWDERARHNKRIRFAIVYQRKAFLFLLLDTRCIVGMSLGFNRLRTLSVERSVACFKVVVILSFSLF